MQVTESEFGALGESFRKQGHDDGAVRLASMRYLCAGLLDHYGRQTASDLGPFKRLLDACIGAFARERDIDHDTVTDARIAIERAGATVSYLQSLPD